MRPVFRIAPMAALAALVLAGLPSASRAGSCEVPLKSHYRCTALDLRPELSAVS